MSISNRVRLYELSRELDLDTKDVIAVCEQLNIVVKSHSSTITESEADLVRTKAPQPHPKTTDPKAAEKKAAASASKNKESEARIAKQQILAVSKPTIRLHTPPASVNVGATPPPSSPNPLSKIAEPSSEPPAKTAVVNPPSSSPMPSASSLIKPPSRPSTSESAKSETTPASTIELPPETALTPPVNPKAIKESQPASQPATKPELITPPTPPKSSDKIVVTNSVKVADPEKATTPAQTAPINVNSPKEQAPKEQQASRKDNPKAERPQSEKTDRPPVAKQSLMSVSPPQVKLNKPVAPERPKPPVSTTPKAIIAPKPPAAKADDVNSPANQGKIDQVNGEQLKGDRRAVTDTSTAPKQEQLKTNRPERPKLNKPAEAPAAPAAGKPQSRGPKLVKDSVLIERGITAPTEPPHNLRPPMPTLMRAPEKPVIADKSGKKPEAGANGFAPNLPELLEKPTLPNKANKRKGKSKEEEEKDLLELKEKNRLNKPKRYLRDFADDDDDSADLDAAAELAQISLSLARPAARPKAAAVPSKPTMAADIKPTQKGKRSAPSRDRRNQQVEIVPEKPTSVEIEEGMTVAVLAKRLVLSETEVIRTLFMKGIMANINQTLDVGTAKMVATDLGYEVHDPEVVELAVKTEMIEVADLDKLQRRPPVVTIMGHVDHGKTTLLDAIRKSKVAQGEAGGITQHIGAYHVDVEHNGLKQQIVFLDTPGHEAFTAMRARGTKVTDIAVLVVAADDGVQPQTIEAISHARAAKVPIVVAINKVDKVEAQPDRIRQELTEYSLVAEEWGGDTIMVPVSAIRRENLDTLLEMILLVAEVEDLQANPNRTAKGTVIEAHLDKAKGPVATLLVQNGTLRVGDIFVAGAAFGKVRAMVDDRGVRVDKASPSFAVEVLGLGDVPAAGDEFEVYLDEKQARAIADQRTMDQRQARLVQAMASRRVTLGTLSEKVKEGDLKELNIILKADVQGSLEAILGALAQLPQREVQLRILLSAPGEITENDISLAAASSAVVLGFNTTMAPGARQAADDLGVDFRDYNVIYKLLEDIQDAMEGLLDPEMIEEYLGQAEVRAIFTIGKGAVAGCYVQNGKLLRNCNVRVKRGNEVVHSAILESLRRVKDDAKEVASGFECGVSLAKFSTWKEGDIIEAYRMVTKRRTLATS
ncbi:translation initiation factor IF-2 [Pseudanabaena sp. FACHB-1998]|uniref:translation initiation factor IF-2 n=1 Tax=Pseudanabaena sp. FACHB-1998 TaxID=2692858 RepID=UPI00168130ED|nr:translation initiation factor IF-2 [Pseudanabaena sp. FACHB-1998]MBD2175742.1 translation initiation factor IF-2 [Pseudanabaena sp. FACHB-1998]